MSVTPDRCKVRGGFRALVRAASIQIEPTACGSTLEVGSVGFSKPCGDVDARYFSCSSKL
jgi:hypothetical protein